MRKLEQEESERLKMLESILHGRVVGQEEAVTAVSRAIRRGRVGLKDPKRPLVPSYSLSQPELERQSFARLWQRPCLEQRML